MVGFELWCGCSATLVWRNRVPGTQQGACRAGCRRAGCADMRHRRLRMNGQVYRRLMHSCLCTAANAAAALCSWACAQRRSPEKTTAGVCQVTSSAIFLRMKNLRCLPRRAMKAVPGVMQLESKGSGSTASPFAICSSLSALRSSADLNLLERCWFILARGATPAMTSSIVCMTACKNILIRLRTTHLTAHKPHCSLHSISTSI